MSNQYLPHELTADIHLLTVFGAVVAAEAPGGKKTRDLICAVERVLATKGGLSVKVKAFRGQKVTTGDNDVGRCCWSLVDKLSTSKATGATKTADTITKFEKVQSSKCLPLGGTSPTDKEV